MPVSLSNDLRERVVAAVDDGVPVKYVSADFNIGIRTIYDWLKIRKDTGSIKPKSGYQNGHSHKMKDVTQFTEFAHKHGGGNLTTADMAIEWEKLTGIKVSASSIRNWLKKIGFTSKKKPFHTKKLTSKSVKNF